VFDLYNERILKRTDSFKVAVSYRFAEYSSSIVAGASLSLQHCSATSHETFWYIIMWLMNCTIWHALLQYSAIKLLQQLF